MRHGWSMHEKLRKRRPCTRMNGLICCVWMGRGFPYCLFPLFFALLFRPLSHQSNAVSHDREMGCALNLRVYASVRSIWSIMNGYRFCLACARWESRHHRRTCMVPLPAVGYPKRQGAIDPDSVCPSDFFSVPESVVEIERAVISAVCRRQMPSMRDPGTLQSASPHGLRPRVCPICPDYMNHL